MMIWIWRVRGMVDDSIQWMELEPAAWVFGFCFL